MGLKIDLLVLTVVYYVSATLGDVGPTDYSLLNVARNPSTPIKYGSNGSVVVALQNALAGVTFSIGREPNGVFDNNTLAAVKGFQQNYGISSDGVVGPATMNLFDLALAIHGCASPGIAYLPQSNVTSAVAAGAVHLLNLYWNYPVGNEFPFLADKKVYVGRVELHFHPWNGTIKPYGYHHGISVYYLLPQTRLTGSQFMSNTNNLAVDQRESLILLELARGNFPACNQLAVTVDTLTLFVASDYLAIGTDSDNVRMPVAAFTAQKIADLYNMTLPTTRMVDIFWKASTTKVQPQPLPPGPDMVTNTYFSKENNLINAEIEAAGAPPCSFVAGDKKDIVLTNLYKEHPTSVAIYGWQWLNGTAIQPLFLGHAAWYADYSHGLRLVNNTALVNGKPANLPDILRDPSLSKLLSVEGPLLDTRIPVAPQWAPACIHS